MLWDRLARPWQCCLEEAWLAYGSGSTPIGAVVTDATGQIIARGRNRIYDDVGDGQHLHGHDLAHAEVNALVTVDYAGLDRQTCALYTTTEPCPLCIGTFYMSGLREFVHGDVELTHLRQFGLTHLFQVARSWRAPSSLVDADRGLCHLV